MGKVAKITFKVISVVQEVIHLCILALQHLKQKPRTKHPHCSYFKNKLGLWEKCQVLGDLRKLGQLCSRGDHTQIQSRTLSTLTNSHPFVSSNHTRREEIDSFGCKLHVFPP